jgi:hypothetical protein
MIQMILSRSRGALVPSLGFLAGLALLKLATDYHRIPVEWAPLITSLALAAMLPEARAAYPRAIFAGHLAAFAVGWLCLLAGVPPLLGATMAVFLMLVLDISHPPAAVTPFILASHPQALTALPVPLIVGCTAVSLLAALLRRRRRA